MGACTTLPKQLKIRSTQPQNTYYSNYEVEWFNTVSIILSFWYRNINSLSVELYEDIECIIQQFSKPIIDRFDSNFITKTMKLSNDEFIVTKTTTYHRINADEKCGLAFGSYAIGKNEFMIWKFKIKQCDFSISTPYITIGICDNDEVDKFLHNANTCASTHKICNAYSLGYNGRIYHEHDQAKYSNGKHYCDKKIKSDDIVEIHLNMKDNTLSFRLNNKD
eukprot:519993_1